MRQDVAITSAHITATSAATTARILVVDDEQYMCDVCARALRRSGYDVVASADAESALAILREEGPFDLLLTDIKMPTISGMELAHLARDVDPAIAIIIMTGHASIDNLHQAVRRGAAEFLCKPFELEQLRLAVEQALHKRSLLQDSLRLRSVEGLLHSSEAINSTLDRNQLTQIVLETAIEQTGCQAGFLLLHDETKGLMPVHSIHGHSALLDGGVVLADTAYRSGQPQLSAFLEPLCTTDNRLVTHGLAMPIRAHGEMLGVLLLCDERPEILRSGVQETIALLTNQAGSALRNAALYGEVQENNQRLHELDRLKGEFIAIASHELRTPLSIVLGYTMMVRDQLENEQHDYLQRVMDSAQRIKDIVDDMVSLRYLETGEVETQLQTHTLQQIVAQALERMQPAAQSKRQYLHASLPSQPLNFVVDVEKTLLVLGNILSNAIKFTPEQGEIEVCGDVWSRHDSNEPASTAFVRIDQTLAHLPEALSTGEWVVFQVLDTGIGIPEHEQSRIFERFYQVADSLTREHGGTGLGLAIVRELVALQNGVVWVTSNGSQGSIFSFAIPYRSGREDSEPHAFA